ncbi:hypothetical protein [Microbacterium jiangjiandongii]|uniref:hypothetical protein n=1 Tax=Microbacterium jiangjiandongii TaxID=3049071 RepID=UPI00214ABA8F|nr:hypothetical protein [Microbacterium sp. zg.Y843]MCR2817086.1 hypothetical protein [Microbacterium sp. zg.Y843]
MTFQMNPDFPRQMAQQVGKVKAALEDVWEAYAGRPLDEVKAALIAAWNGVGNGASITDPDLTTVASRISAGKRVWLEDHGRIMCDD